VVGEGEGDPLRCERDPAEEIAALRAALAAERAKGDAFALLSHELRTLVSGIAGITSVLLDSELTAEQRDYLKRVRALCDTLTGLSNNVLDWSRIEAGKLKLDVGDLDVRRVAEDVGELFAERAQAKQLELAVSVAEDVPAGLRGDTVRLRQVLVNLVSNAIKFTDRGEVSVRVAVAERGAAHAVLRFDVRDTGVGIGPEAQAQLFQPFSQVHDASVRDYGGSGLGLALVRRIVEAMDGTIGVESAAGQGSNFHFTARFERRPSLEARGAIPRVDAAGRRVLCAIPSAAVRASLAEMAAALGVEHAAAETGERARALLSDAVRAGKPFDVALLDVGLPGAGELFHAMDTDAALVGIPVVLLAYPGQKLPEDDRGSGRNATPITAGSRGSPRGALRPVGHLAKPVRRAQLWSCLRTLMGGAVETVADAGPESRRAPASQRLAPSTGATSPRARSVSFSASEPTPEPARAADDRPIVLLVEDNEVNQKVGKLMVEKRGYRVDVASDGHEAVAATGRVAYAAVLMDCQMPRLDGYAATREIRARDAGKPRLPIIAMTANAGPGARERCIAAGMDDYVAKPVTAEAIDEVLRRWVGRDVVAPTPPPPPPRRASSPAIDLEMLHKLRAAQREGEPDIVREVVAIFLNEAPGRMKAIRDAAEIGDLTTAARTAHTLKGSAGHLGAKTLGMLCARFEDKVRSGVGFNAAFAVDAIEEELERVRRALLAEGKARGA
jgi:CheY-like chemotaxis protein/HPt (histidine-containing phosphotransfer) domain-containing protein/anti-sigma regulatory factor (Ser/Thr protein kinase)